MKTPGLLSRSAACCGAVALLFLAGCASTTPAPVVERGVPGKVATSPSSGKDFYTVKKGDTLYSIALDHGQDYKDVAAWNNLDNPNRILVGQQLRVAPADSGAGGAVVAKPIGAGVVESRPLDGSAAPVAASDGVKREPKAGKEAYSDQAWAKTQNPAPAKESKAAEAPARSEVAPAAAAAAPAASDLNWMWPAGGKASAGFNEATNKGVDIAGKLGEPVLAAADGKVVYSGSGLRGYGKLVIVKHDATFLSAYAHNNNILVKEGQNVTRGQKIAEMGNSDTDQVKLHFEIRRQGKPVDPLQYLPKR